MMEENKHLENELETLWSRLKQSQDKITFWMTEEMNKSSQLLCKKHEKLMKEGEAEKERLKNAFTLKEKEDKANDNKLVERCGQLEQLKSELEKLCAITQKLHSDKANKEALISDTKQDIQKVQKDIDAPTQAKQKLEYLSKASGVFGNALGLSFRKTRGNKMQVIFTNIDEKDPLMAFYFFLQIQGASRKYVVTDPEPPIEGVEELVAQVNETNNFRQFIIRMRNKFKETVKK